MKYDFFELYNTISGGVESDVPVSRTFFGERWALSESSCGAGIAMATPGESIAPFLPDGISGIPVCEAAKAVSSWNLTEASLALACANSYYNTPVRAEALGALAAPSQHYSCGIDFQGKRVALIGHLHVSDEMRREAAEVCTLERDPQPGDFPDAACDLFLPQSDIVIITGSSIINKTLPHLLSLCENAYTVLTGPSVPLCPSLLELGIDRIAGLCLTDRCGIEEHVKSGARGSPYCFGESFILSR